jgi:hypothetical protein
LKKPDCLRSEKADIMKLVSIFIFHLTQAERLKRRPKSRDGDRYSRRSITTGERNAFN